jgi:uncharacterized protein YutE (UPF0331/DUF86 family)
MVSATGAVPEKVVNFWVVFGVLACELAACYRHVLAFRKIIV